MAKSRFTVPASNFPVIPAEAGIPLAFNAPQESGTPALARATIPEDRRG